ncbi:phage major capsid protein [Nesterenkonia suensis]
MPNTGFYPPAQVQPKLRDYVSNPTEIRRDLDELINKATIADYAFAQGPANNGAVVYDEVTGRVGGEREAEAIAPGAEFPHLDGDTIEPKTAKTQKFGGRADLTWEARDRNEWDTMTRKMNLLRQRVIQKVNQVSVSALTANQNVRTFGVGTAWGESGSDPVGDIMRAAAVVEEDEDFAYQANLALVNPVDKRDFLLSREIRDQFPRESRELNPALSGDIDGIAGLEWITSPSVPEGTIWAFQREVIGSVRDAGGGLQVHSFDDDVRQVAIIQAWRHIVPIITDPLAAVKITGFRN